MYLICVHRGSSFGCFLGSGCGLRVLHRHRDGGSEVSIHCIINRKCCYSLNNTVSTCYDSICTPACAAASSPLGASPLSACCRARASSMEIRSAFNGSDTATINAKTHHGKLGIYARIHSELVQVVGGTATLKCLAKLSSICGLTLHQLKLEMTRASQRVRPVQRAQTPNGC